MKKFRKGIPTACIATGLVALFAAANADAGCGCQRACCDPWDGAYLGVSFGAGTDDHIDQSIRRSEISTQSQTIDSATTTFLSTSRESGTLNGNATGSLVNLFVGYNFHPSWYCSRFVLGAQLEGTVFNDVTYKVNGVTRGVSLQSQTTSDGTTSVPGTFVDTINRADELRSTFVFLGRAGYLFQPCLLVYGLVGGVEGNFVLPCCNDGDGIKRSRWQLGYTVGVGLEYRITDRWSLRAEYRYLSIDVDRSASSSSTSTSTSTTASFTSRNSFAESSNTRFKFNLGQIGIVYHFC